MNDKADFERLGRLVDPSGMLELAREFPAHMEDAWRIGRSFAGDIPTGDYGQVVVCGMGGSAIGGDMLRSFLGDRFTAPLISVRAIVCLRTSALLHLF
jgi:glucose/mannose-6-phosphate isomerase